MTIQWSKVDGARVAEYNGLNAKVFNLVPNVFNSSILEGDKYITFSSPTLRSAIERCESILLRTDYISTFLGHKFRPLRPDPSMIDIRDIAHALSLQCRFGGHCKWHHSVAYHSYLVSLACDTKDQLAGLLHDATEAYLVDLPTPIKRCMPEYMFAEDQLAEILLPRFGLSPTLPPSVLLADKVILAAEFRDIMPYAECRDELPPPWPGTIKQYSPGEAEALFISRFNELTSTY